MTVHHQEQEQEWKTLRMSVEYSPSWEDSSAVNGLLREVDLAYNNDDGMVITMKM